MRSHCTIRPAPIAIIVAILTIASPSIHAQSMSPRAIALAVDAAMRGLGGTSYKARFVRVRPGGDTVVLEGEVYFNPAPDRGTLGGDLLIETSDSVRYTFDGTDVAILDRHAHRITLGDVTTDAPMLIASGRHSSLIPGLIRSKDTLSKIVARALSADDRGTVTIDGATCRRLEIHHPDKGICRDYVSIIDLGVDDWFPRHIVTIYSVNGVEQREELTIAKPTHVNLDRPDLFQTKPRVGDSVIAYDYPPVSPLLATGTLAPDWTLIDDDRVTHSLNEYRGCIVVLDFWFTHCNPCLAVLPKLQRIADRYGDRGVVVLGIDCAPSDSGSATRVMLQSGAAYGTLFGGMHITRRYKVELFPSLYIIGRDGTVRYTHRGNSEELEGEVAAAIEGILGER